MRKFISVLVFSMTIFICSAQWGYPSYDDLFRQAFGVSRQSNSKKQKDPIEKIHMYESNGFEWIKLEQYNSATRDWYYGAETLGGKTIIPLSRKFKHIYFQKEEGHVGYFEVEDSNENLGAYTIDGTVIFSPQKISILYCDVFNIMKNGSNEWVETKLRLSSEGKLLGRTSSSTSNQYYNYGVSDFQYNGDTYNSSTTVNGINPENTLNQTVGENCMTCKGTGKCPTCNGSKTAHSFGNSYKCNVCDGNGNCPSCHGAGKASWNR